MLILYIYIYIYIYITNNFGFRCVPNDLVNLFGLDSNDRNFDYQIAITRKRKIFLSFESDLQTKYYNLVSSYSKQIVTSHV
jgi:hypothetical protein